MGVQTRTSDPDTITTVMLGIVVALLSALWFAAAGAVQHSVTNSIAARSPASAGHFLPVLAVAWPILSNRVWWFGLSLNALGFVFHASALHLTSLTVVQAILSLQLMFAVPFGALRNRRAPLARDWFGAALVCLGIVILMVARGAEPHQLARPGWVAPAMLGAAGSMVLLVALAKSSRIGRTAFIGTAAGIGYSITATYITIITAQVAASGWWAPLSHWHVYALAASGLMATVITQDAFASGSFPAALTAMTIADPVASFLWAALLFDRVPPATPIAIGSLTISALAISAGVALLAYSPTVALVLRNVSPADDDAHRDGEHDRVVEEADHAVHHHVPAQDAASNLHIGRRERHAECEREVEELDQSRA